MFAHLCYLFCLLFAPIVNLLHEGSSFVTLGIEQINQQPCHGNRVWFACNVFLIQNI